MAADLPASAGDPLAVEDPQGALRMALSRRCEPAAAEDVLLAWLLRLPDGVDPACAADRLLGGAEAGRYSNQRLLALLAEVARWPMRRLGRLRHARAPGRDSSRPRRWAERIGE